MKEAAELAEAILRGEEMLFASDAEWNDLCRIQVRMKFAEVFPDPNRLTLAVPMRKLPSFEAAASKKPPSRTAYRNQFLAYAAWEITEQCAGVHAAANAANSALESETACGVVAEVFNKLRREKNSGIPPVSYNTIRKAFSDSAKLRPVSPNQS